MNVNLIAYTPNADFIAGRAAALCVGGNIHDVEACAKALKGALASGHVSVAEHNAFTFLIEGVSRVTLAQLTRHRLASFSVESQRYCGANLDTVTPDSVTPDSVVDASLVDDLVYLKRYAEEVYKKMLNLGVPEEDARYYTLQGGKTRLVMTMNARELLHFFELRCCNRAQWEIRELADMMLAECQAVAPGLFNRAGCACMQGKPCPEGARACGHPRPKTKEVQEHEGK